MNLTLPYDDFESAATEALEFLHSRLGFSLWMVTRTEGNDWIVLNANDHGYEVKSGDVFAWTDSFCSQMVKGLGPRIAPRSSEIPAYADAPIGQQVSIESYIGVPLTRKNGRLFGTLCAIDPLQMPDEIVAELPLIEMVARQLATILEYELRAQEKNRLSEQASFDEMMDPLTGLYSLSGWNELLKREERRCQRYGSPTCLFSIRMDTLAIVNDREGIERGDAILKRASSALFDAMRSSDIVARVRGDEFAIAAVECREEFAHLLKFRVEGALQRVGVSASVGMAIRSAAGTMQEAFAEANQKMLQNKNQRNVPCGFSQPAGRS